MISSSSSNNYLADWNNKNPIRKKAPEPARIYYYQTFHLLRFGRYNPQYVIQFSYLTSRLQTELNQQHGIDLIYVLKQALCRIFQDINLDIYHNNGSLG
jgi:hypothetical protein